MKMIWATRGRNWGFRFLRNGGFSDPLPEYDKAFGGHSAELQLWLPRADSLTLRFPDPLERKDAAGRTIAHDFVVFNPAAGLMESFESAQQNVWADVAQEYSAVWDFER